jgi:hypothetical protein
MFHCATSKATMNQRLLPCLLLLSTLSPLTALAQKSPPPNIESWGVCPFECCTYRDWTADGDVPVHQRRDEKSPVVFRLRQGDPVDGITGVVVAKKPAPVTVDRDVQDGFVKGKDAPQLSFKAGDKVYMVAPLGEGTYRFWYRGKFYTSGEALTTMPGVEAREASFIWWKQVRNKAGRSGWTSSEKFTHVDACG